MANTSIVYDDFYYKWKTSNGSEDRNNQRFATKWNG
jgi:hypothetical protein